MPKIILENILPRRLVRDPQLAEQLVAVPTPFPAHVPVPRLEDQLVEVPQTHIVPRSFFVSTDRNIWCQLRGLLVEVWHHPHPVDPPTGIHRQARAGYKYWPRVSGRPCDHAARVPAVQVVRSSTECWTFQLCHRRDTTVQFLNKVVDAGCARQLPMVQTVQLRSPTRSSTSLFSR